jgi:hypothetical protein
MLLNIKPIGDKMTQQIRDHLGFGFVLFLLICIMCGGIYYGYDTVYNQEERIRKLDHQLAEKFKQEIKKIQEQRRFPKILV